MGYKTKIQETLAQLSGKLLDRGGPDPRTILRGCIKAMEQGRKNLLEKTYVPNLYRVYMRGKDLAEMGPLLDSIRRELTAHLAGEIRGRKYATTTPGVTVDIVEYSELGRRSFRVDAIFTEDELPTGTDASDVDPGGPPGRNASPGPESAGAAPTVPPRRVPPTEPARKTRKLDTGSRAAATDDSEGATRILEEFTVVLEVVSPGERGRVIKLGPGSHTLGRGKNAAVRFEDPEEFLSRIHAELEVSESAVTIRDMGSANGTFVNDRPAAGEALEAGDTIRLGKFELTYRGPVGAGPTVRD